MTEEGGLVGEKCFTAVGVIRKDCGRRTVNAQLVGEVGKEDAV
jgi:hypothetical protein